MITPEFLTVREVAIICRVHEVTIRRHIRQGLLRAVRVGRKLRVRQDDLERYTQQAGGNDGLHDEEPSDVSSDIHTALADAIYEHKFSGRGQDPFVTFGPDFLSDLDVPPADRERSSAPERSSSDPFYELVRALRREPAAPSEHV